MFSVTQGKTLVINQKDLLVLMLHVQNTDMHLCVVAERANVHKLHLIIQYAYYWCHCHQNGECHSHLMALMAISTSAEPQGG